MTVDFMMRGTSPYKDPPAEHQSSVPPSRNGIPQEDNRSRLTHQSSIDSQTGLINDQGRVSFLAVPSTPISARRPSTADVVIEKLQVEKVDGGGITISGVVLAGNCHISLIIFGIFFLLVGIVLSFLAFAYTHEDENSHQHPGKPLGHSHNHTQMQIFGPVCLILGVLMLLFGVLLCCISNKITKDEKEKRTALSIAQLNQLESNFYPTNVNTSISPVHASRIAGTNQSYPILYLRRGSWWTEPTPVELSSKKCDANGLSTDGSGFPTGRRSSTSSTMSVLYGDNCSVDIATFPSESFEGHKTHYDQSPPNELRKCKRQGSIQSEKQSQIMEVDEAPSSISRSPSSGNWDDLVDAQAPIIPIITVSNVPLTPTVPIIDVKEIPSQQVSAVTLPLSKNGVALPRHSRHSISRIDGPLNPRNFQSSDDR